MTYRHVLAAVDLTDESRQVVDTARSVANDNNSKLSLISVVKPLAQVYGGLDMALISQGDVSFEHEAEVAARAQLEDLARTIDVEVTDVHVKIGGPALEIRQGAEDLEADLIVIGTHGRHGLGLLLGSTANGVLHGVKCDVLTVRIK